MEQINNELAESIIKENNKLKEFIKRAQEKKQFYKSYYEAKKKLSNNEAFLKTLEEDNQISTAEVKQLKKKRSRKEIVKAEKEIQKYKANEEKLKKQVQSLKEERKNGKLIMKFKKRIIDVRVKVFNKSLNKEKWFRRNYEITIPKSQKEASEEDLQNVKDQFYDEISAEYVNENTDSNENIQQFDILEINLHEVKMKGGSLQYNFLQSINPETVKQHNNCVIDYIWNEITLTNQNKYKKFTKQQLIQQLEDCGAKIEEGINTCTLISWITNYHQNKISLYALSPMYEVIQHYVPKDSHNVCLTLVFIINNNHLYPIYNKEMKKFVSKAKRLDMSVMKQSNVIDYTDYKVVNYSNYNTGDLDFGIDVTRTEYQDLLEGKLTNKVILVDHDLFDVATDIVNHTKCMTLPNIKNGSITSFIHPETNQIIEYAPDYEGRKKLCDTLFEKFGYDAFKFKNQSYAQVANALFEIQHGKIETMNSGTVEDNDIIDNFHTIPLVKTLVQNFEKNGNCFGIDIVSSYPNGVLQLSEDIPIFSITDHFKKFDGELEQGEYLIDSFVIERFGGLVVQKQIMNESMVNYLLMNKFITQDKILLKRKASYVIKTEPMKQFVKFIMELLPKEQYKPLLVSWIGSFGKRFTTVDKGCVTDSLEIVSAILNDKKTNEDFGCTHLNGLWFVRLTSQSRRNHELSSVFRAVVCQGMINLLELCKQVIGENSRLIGYNTDCLFVENPVNLEIVDNKKYKFEDWKPRLYREFVKRDDEVVLFEPKQWNHLEDVCLDGQKIVCSDPDYLFKLENKSFCATGGAGCQKTTIAKALLSENTLVLCPSNKACEVIRKTTEHDMIYTFDSYFFKRDEITKGIDKVIVDEFSMMGVNWLNVLYNIKQKNPKTIFQIFGDPNQCSPVQSRYFDYMNSPVFRFIVDCNLMEKKYVPGCSRYDEELHLTLEYFKQTGMLHPLLINKEEKEMTTNICKYNNTRKLVNDVCLDGKDWFVGMGVVANDNRKKKELYNSTFYKIEAINGDKIKVEGNEFWFGKSLFDPDYCVTTYRYQGETISNDVCIYDVSSMNFNELYTAMSRCRSLKQIHLKYCDRVFHKMTEPKNPTKVKLSSCKVGEIYLMENIESNVYYVGMTTTNTQKRFEEHQLDKKDEMHKYPGVWTCKTIAKLHYWEKEDIEKIETHYIQLYQTKCTLINKKQLAQPERLYEKPTICIENKEKFRICETKNKFIIRYTENGKRKSVVRWYNDCNKENVLQKMQSLRQDLILSFA